MVRAPDRIAFNLPAALHDHRAVRQRDMGPHVFAVGVKQDRPAALAPVKHEVVTEIAQTLGLVR